ncbi:DUF4232 domain-containing protein [Streptomyces sp. NPDC058739]|uniref:DUF4232 domain-containing protein n=1 Tax=Streptomyces sp. NPDC058739 TaxID=3346618 RepID=UPI00369A9CE2
MRVRHTVIAAASAALVVTLALTGCQDSKSKSHGSSSGKKRAHGGAHSGSDDDSAQGSGSSGGADGVSGTPVSACTTATTTLTFVVAAAHATASEPATATVKLTNTSAQPCAVVGAVTLTARDDQDKSAPVETDSAAAGTDSVTVAPGATATAEVRYTDLNFEGSASAREVCAVQASKVEIALPDDVGREVQAVDGAGSSAVFSVCDPEVTLGAFRV